MDPFSLLLELVRVTPSPYAGQFDICFPLRDECNKIWRENGILADVSDVALDQLRELFWADWPELRRNLLANMKPKRTRAQPVTHRERARPL